MYGYDGCEADDYSLMEVPRRKADRFYNHDTRGVPGVTRAHH